MQKLLLLAILAISVLGLPNQRPIIGIYTQSDEDDQPTMTKNTLLTYIAASYIKFIEMSGAQVVPIFAYGSQSIIAQQLTKINGVLFPGGGVEFDITKTWTSNANFILQYAIQQNDQGKVFPVWGTCLGLQLLSYLTADYKNVLSPVRGQTALLNTIKFTDTKGYLFETMPDRLIQKLTTGQGITYFNHHYAVLSSTYDNNRKLSDFWKITAETTSSYNQKFISVMQGKKYPFYAVQFHPQKSIFEWKVYSDKSYDSIQMVQTISNKFINKARQSLNQFNSNQQFQSASILNYPLSNTTMSFTRIYQFNQTVSQVKSSLTSEGQSDVFRIENLDSERYHYLWATQNNQQIVTSQQ